MPMLVHRETPGHIYELRSLTYHLVYDKWAILQLILDPLALTKSITPFCTNDQMGFSSLQYGLFTPASEIVFKAQLNGI